MSTFKPIAVNRTGVNLLYKEGQYIVATRSFTDGSTVYEPGVYVDMLGARQQLTMTGPQGPKGDTGGTGAPGEAATISVGQVTSGAPGGAPQVSNSGTPQKAVFNFVIPQGDIGKRGRQGAGWFHTMSASGSNIAISSLQPSSLTPFVGDAVMFPNGDVRQITAVSGSTVSLGEVLWSNKGDPGIGNATLSNIDGNSTTDGFTQAAVKGVAQAKNYYNLGAFDTYVSNGDGTGTVTRRTECLVINENSTLSIEINPNGTSRCVIARNLLLKSSTNIKANYLKHISFDNIYIGEEGFNVYGGNNIVVSIPTLLTAYDYANYFSQNPLIFEYESNSALQYTERVIENQSIHIANQEEEFYWHEEWQKGLNLIDLSKTQSQTIYGVTFTINNGSVILNGTNTNGASAVLRLFNDLDKVKGKTITLNGKISDNIFLEGNYVDSEGITHYFNETGVPDGSKPVHIPKNARSVSVYCGVRARATADNVTIYPMLVYGAHSYPYTSYHGKLIHEKDLSGVQLFPEGENPAQTIGGDWEDKGTVTTSDGTTFHAYRRLS